MTVQASDIINLVVTIGAVAVVVRFIVEALKQSGAIDAGDAGRVQGVINAVLALVAFAAGYFGFEIQSAAAIEKALRLAPGILELVMFFLAVVGTKAAHEVFKAAGIILPERGE